jgi:tetratricopeptide (TPR) repeat protein
VKLIIAAEIDPGSMEKELDLSIGFAVFNQVGAPVASGQERKIYSANSDLPIRYDLAIAVDPGTYRFRLAAIDTAGMSGSVEREVHAFGMSNQAVAVGDLILSAVRQGKPGDVRPPVILQIADGQLATYTELYTNKAGTLDDTNVMFEVADTEDGPTLQTGAAEIRERTDKTMRQAMAVVPVGALPPGRYIARAIILSSDKIVGKLTRPFTIVPSSARRSAVTAGSAKVDASAMATGIVVSAAPAGFKKEDVLTPDMLRAVFEVMDKAHPAAKAATARARSGKLDGTALMALDAGDQAAGSILRGLELFMKGQLDPAANQFNVAARNAPDAPIAMFFLGACYAAAGRDKEAISAWERARAGQLDLPALQLVLAEGWLRLGQPGQALEPLGRAHERQPDNDAIRRSLAIAQSHVGQHEQAYKTIVPFLEKNTSDTDALLVALHALYQVRLEGRTIGTADEDKARAATYARAYAAAKGPQTALVEKWADFLQK